MVMIQQLLSLAVQRNASDLHLISGFHPIVRIDGRLMPVTDVPVLGPQENVRFLQSVMSKEQFDLFTKNREFDFSFSLPDGNRFRVNAYYELGKPGAAFRYIPKIIPQLEQLGLPEITKKITGYRQGFVLVTGPTGHGKSTTLAAIINTINLTRAEHILTIEDPVEYVFPKAKSIISQRELNIDTHGWSVALRSALREDPDIVLVGEMRDHETIAAALTVAETGHLVFATLHTNSAAQTIDRIVDVFPEHQQGQIRMQLSNTLAVVISQRLLPRVDHGRVVATEVLVGTSAVRNIVREGKTHLLENVIRTSREAGMSSIEDSLARLVREGSVAVEVAREWAIRPDEFSRLVQR